MKTLYMILLTVFAFVAVYAQNEDALNIPVETDNQFPPDHSESEGLIEGSGAGAVIEPDFDVTTEFLPLPDLESIESTSFKVASELEQTSVELPCPKPCVCSIEGDTDNFITDCSGYDLSEFPTSLDTRTTTLNLQNNKLTEIPKDIATLLNLKVLNANNNKIMAIAAGSISELPELVTLKIANNRLIEYPKDLKNSISLNKLEELDLGGNDMRTSLSPELFLNFKALRKLTLPATSNSEFVADLCESMTETLETVCTETCEAKYYDCPNGPEDMEDGLLKAVLPGVISLNSGTIDDDDDTNDPILNTNNKSLNAETTAEPFKDAEKIDEQPKNTQESPKNIDNTEEPPKGTETTTIGIIQTVNEFSLRSAVNSAPQDDASDTIVEIPKDIPGDVKIGAKTIASKTGGVDKSVIGIILAGMIVVVAGITIKKNWSSITKRFSSTPRPNERTTRNTNGTAAEEVPLQDKSPV